jgi:hypothetical protein
MWLRLSGGAWGSRGGGASGDAAGLGSLDAVLDLLVGDGGDVGDVGGHVFLRWVRGQLSPTATKVVLSRVRGVRRAPYLRRAEVLA